jgi:hypothetical protein
MIINIPEEFDTAAPVAVLPACTLVALIKLVVELPSPIQLNPTGQHAALLLLSSVQYVPLLQSEPDVLQHTNLVGS